MLRYALLVVSLCFLSSIRAIPIDNGVEGDPEIECGSTSISISFNTRNPFEGKVAVLGHYQTPGCTSNATGGRVAVLNIPFTSCGVQRVRSLNPRGVFIRSAFAVQFHPLFITKVDRAYQVQCFYMEADKTVSQELEVSQLTTGPLQTQVVPMPVCRYEILDGAPNAPPVRYAIVGQMVYHKWTCDSETDDTFCMRVYSCFVSDGATDQATIIDERGCATDRFLLQNLNYITDLMAGQEAHVFKYADRAQLFFQCQIALTIKEPGATCPHPQCEVPGSSVNLGGGGGGSAGAGGAGGAGSSGNSSQPAGRPGRRFFKREVVPEMEQVGVVDVTANFESLDIQTNQARQFTPEAPGAAYVPDQLSKIGQERVSTEQSGVCLSPVGFGLLVALIIVLLSSASVVLVLCTRRWKNYE